MKEIKLLLLSLLLLSSCRKDIKDIPQRDIKTYHYQIDKGNHSANGVNFQTHSNKTGFDFYITLDANCYYDLSNDNNYDINKIFGYTWGFDPGNNSFRIGWNCYKKNGLIQIFYYTHNFKVRNPAPTDNYDKTLLFEAPTGTRMHFWGDFLRWPGAIRIYSSEYSGYVDVPFNFVNVPLWGVYNNPYFGGDEVAPHTMNFTIER